MLRAAVPLFACLLAAACARGDENAIDVAVIGDPVDLSASGLRLAPPGELVRAATTQGLVRLDEAGQIVPAIAERWIVTDDGMSYIFRIRELDLAGGKRLTARRAQQALRSAMASLSGTSLGLDLAQVRDVRAMTGRVIEIRLKSPMPGFLQLLAQPELGITVDGTPTGPMATITAQPGGPLLLRALPPEARGLPTSPGWAEEVRAVRLFAGEAGALTRRFLDGDFAVLLGGTLATLPLADTGPLARGTVRIDPALGLFGLDVLRAEGFLSEVANREALALVLDREALIQPFNLAGWTATTRVVAPGLPDDPGLAAERWQGMDLAARRSLAASRIARWKAANGGRLELRLRLPQGPGSDLLFAALAEQYRTVGIVLTRSEGEDRADLGLRDRVARYAGARWFLNQFACRTSAAICSEDVDLLAQLAVQTRDPVQQARYLADAETAFTATNGFIPIGAPIRWSLVRSGVQGFAENAHAAHPLFPLTAAPM
ncbi:ABC transporter substrate-binding protein [Qipengyuania sediminis]|uniref:ABC transporter substrate-binding protein n=1 Tax=Qipengyuania sediminis TaxID=1532023 RepID=UPI00105A4954|nr:ABC transporter substrate-binding protein [Qipengyuania sediminis]